MGIRRKSREIALQALYHADLCGLGSPDMTTLCSNFKIAKKAMPYATELVEGITAHVSQIDSTIKKYSQNWRVDRMSIIDRNLIRIAAFELLFSKDVPPTVVINEAIEIAKKFGNDESPSFINGILDALSDGKE